MNVTADAGSAWVLEVADTIWFYWFSRNNKTYKNKDKVTKI